MARLYSSTDTNRKGKLKIRKKRNIYSVFFTAPKEILEEYDEDQLVNPLTREILSIDTTAKKLTVYPYWVRGRDPMGPRYSLLESITLDIYLTDDVVITEDDVKEILEMEIPKVFLKDYHFGLGFRQDYRYIPDLLEDLDIRYLNVIQSGKSQLQRENATAYLKTSDLNKLKKRIDYITNKGRKISDSVRRGAASALFMDILSNRKEKNTNEVLQNIEAVLKTEITATPCQSPKKKAAEAIQTIEKNAENLIKEKPETLFKLKNDIEAFALKELITRFEKCLVETNLNQDGKNCYRKIHLFSIWLSERPS